MIVTYSYATTLGMNAIVIAKISLLAIKTAA